MSLKLISLAFQLVATVATIHIPIHLESSALEINGYPEQVYQVALDMRSNHIELDHGFSFGIFYGFETTSEIRSRYDADLAINGLFYNSYGMPYGIMVDNGKVIGINSTGGPTVVIDQDNNVAMTDLTINGFVAGNTSQIQLWGVNVSAPEYSFVLYDAVYGTTTRIYRNSISYVIKDGIVIDIVKGDTPVETNSGDYILVHITPFTETYFSIGESIQVTFEPIGYEGSIKEAFQTGGWLVKDGNNVAKDYEPYVGHTNSLQPRTLVGVTGTDQLVFLVVDGRNPGISEGVTGKWAAELLISVGCIYGGYLDGGASSTLVVGGQVMNRPSEGTERAIAHAVLIHIAN